MSLAQRQNDETDIYCVVPPELTGLDEVLANHFADDSAVSVVLDRRRGQRRSGWERRTHGGSALHLVGRERRLAPGLEGRRFAERRARLASITAAPELPPEARDYVDQLTFVAPAEPASLRLELAQLRALTNQWRQRCLEASRDASMTQWHARSASRDALLASLAARNRYTWEHSEAVVGLAVACARELGLKDEQINDLYDVALLHDIGKLGIPDSILAKAAPLTSAEWDVMRQHPVIGAGIFSSIETLSSLAPAVRAEHERWDGRGYPDGLAGEDIPIASRITFVCDAYHAMISDRPYRDALSPDVARGSLLENIGSQFCPTSADALMSVLDAVGRGTVGLTQPATAPSAAVPEAAEVRQAEEEPTLAEATVAEPTVAEAQLERERQLRVALERLLDSTPGRVRYRPFVLVARLRGEAAVKAARRAQANTGVIVDESNARCVRMTAAIERLLDATRCWYGYPAMEFTARFRAEDAINWEPSGESGSTFGAAASV